MRRKANLVILISLILFAVPADVLSAQSGNQGFAECLPPPSGMIAWWPFDRFRFFCRSDEIVFSNDVSIRGNEGFIATLGVIGAGAFSLDGVLNFAEVFTSSPVQDLNFGIDGDFTIDAWILPSDSPLLQVIVDKDGPFPEGGYTFFLDGNLLTFNILGEGGGVNFGSSASIVPDALNYVAVTVARNQNPPQISVTFYVNGISPSSGSIARSLNVDNSARLLIGRRRTTTVFQEPAFFQGLIDEVQIFNRALTAEEINGIFMAGLLGKCKEDRNVPWDEPFCTSSLSEETNVEICNHSGTDFTYQLSGQPLPWGTVPASSKNSPGRPWWISPNSEDR